ncbi:MAG: cell division protein FtsQ/DivIB [Chitinophagaceae bacterium]|nr:cell division protein FtsQ/DivIB [Chitinophagaceae bacterium]
MNTRKTIRKILFACLWLTIGTCMLLLLMAAIGKQQNETCKDVEISITGAPDDKQVLQDKDILKLLKAATNGPVVGQSRKRFDLWKMEKLLEGNMWVKDARIYFDNKDVLHVKVEQRQPMARVFTTGGKSFYLDESGQVMHLSDQLKISLPVFTGFPEKAKPGRTDSLIIKDMLTLSEYIQNDKFWNAQIGQVDVVIPNAKEWGFELVPVVGNHLIKLGDANNIEQKFNRLYQFYRQVVPRAGLEKYKIVDVRFAGQVVAEKK